MSPETILPPVADSAPAPIHPLKPPLLLHEPADHPADRTITANAAAARRPILPTHTTGAASHAQHHVPVKAQA